jgi:hypothetical protein
MKLSKGIAFALASLALTASIASADSSTMYIKGTQLAFTMGSSIRVISPLTGTFSGGDSVKVTVEVGKLTGDLYLYLLNPVTKGVVATAAFPKATLKTDGQNTLTFDLAKSKAQSQIIPGSYRIVACDMGNKSVEPICAGSFEVTIAAYPLSISSIDPSAIYPNTNVTITGTGFSSGSYVLLDGAWNPFVTLRALSSDVATISLQPGVALGKHTVQIAGTGAPSNPVQVTVLAPSAPSISGVQRSGSVVTILGSGMSRSYPSKVEIMQNGRLIKTIDPTALNYYAISANGTQMRFLMPSLASSQDLTIRVSNGDAYKSGVLSLSL